MTALIFSLAIGLLQVFSHQPISHADLLPSSIAVSTPDQSTIQPVAYAPIQPTVVAVVPASAFPSCKNATGDVLYVIRAQQSPTIAGDNDIPSDGPTCATSSSSYAGADAGEPLSIVPSNEDGTPSQQPCMTITTPQYYCEIPSGSLLSAFPLA